MFVSLVQLTEQMRSNGCFSTYLQPWQSRIPTPSQRKLPSDADIVNFGTDPKGSDATERLRRAYNNTSAVLNIGNNVRLVGRKSSEFNGYYRINFSRSVGGKTHVVVLHDGGDWKLNYLFSSGGVHNE